MTHKIINIKINFFSHEKKLDKKINNSKIFWQRSSNDNVKKNAWTNSISPKNIHNDIFSDIMDRQITDNDETFDKIDDITKIIELKGTEKKQQNVKRFLPLNYNYSLDNLLE